MQKNLWKAIVPVLTASLVAVSAVSIAAPPPPPPGGIGFRGPGPRGPRGPGFRPGFRPGPPPPRYHHHHHYWGDVLGGAMVLGLGWGLANALTSPTYVTPTVPVAPYVPPNYIVTPYPNVVPVAPTVVVPPASVITTTPAPSGNVMYWCEASKNFYPYVTQCTSGWETRIMPK